eukprot:scaffold624756_cov19-Prasinocladus_malaysianus.AAC.1
MNADTISQQYVCGDIPMYTLKHAAMTSPCSQVRPVDSQRQKTKTSTQPDSWSEIERPTDD